jgi:hypothetical protein
VTIFIMFRFSRRDCHSSIFGHVSKNFTFVTLRFSSQRFKHVVTSSLCFTRPSWITPLCMTFKKKIVPIFSSAIHNFMSKIITCIT